MAGGYLFVTAIAEGATLAVHTERRADLGMVGYEMTMLATRAGHALSPGVRAGTSQ
jgi:predicted regulator of Ras-like GTPase activity (Roadblock/LC7/MglB family)